MIATIDWNFIATWLSEPKHLFDAISFVLGLLYLFLEFKASIWLWPVGIIMPLVHSVTYYKAGLYADFGMEFFYVAVAIYGFCKWRAGGKSSDKPITHFPVRLIAVAVVAFIAIWAGLYWFLSTCTDSTVPVLDAFTTALSIVAYWALAQKWAEQWLLWLVVDAVCAVLYMHKGIPFSAVRYGFYTIMAVLGYRNWLRLMRQQQ
ncbi:MAG: nicotinamide riboside transporter PnuC [Bacteroidales bacterium]|nr:nicotinamide riboside transporter PnuC [Bacteroidales bacterium]